MESGRTGKSGARGRLIEKEKGKRPQAGRSEGSENGSKRWRDRDAESGHLCQKKTRGAAIKMIRIGSGRHEPPSVINAGDYWLHSLQVYLMLVFLIH